VSGLTWIGSLPLADGRAIRNDCYPDQGVCGVQYDYGSALPAPFGGILRCFQDERGDDYYVLEGSNLSLRLHVSRFGGGRFSSDECVVREIEAGETLPGGRSTGLWAFAADGSPLSLVVTHDGNLYVGELDLQFGCPCEPRS
jgi:hypothetical protein